jgi:hypothetical protein
MLRVACVQAVSAATQAASLHTAHTLEVEPSIEDSSIQASQFTEAAASSTEGPTPCECEHLRESGREHMYQTHCHESLDSVDVARHDAEMQRLLHKEKACYLTSLMPTSVMSSSRDRVCCCSHPSL